MRLHEVEGRNAHFLVNRRLGYDRAGTVFPLVFVVGRFHHEPDHGVAPCGRPLTGHGVEHKVLGPDLTHADELDEGLERMGLDLPPISRLYAESALHPSGPCSR